MYIQNSELSFVLFYRLNVTTLSIGKKYQQSNVFVPVAFYTFFSRNTYPPCLGGFLSVSYISHIQSAENIFRPKWC